jgi:hypothetical protein
MFHSVTPLFLLASLIVIACGRVDSSSVATLGDRGRGCAASASASPLCDDSTLQNRLSGTSPKVKPAPTPAASIPLVLLRIGDSTSASVTVANGIPLKPGALMPSALKDLRVTVNGVEQPLYVEALKGLWPDGSLRAVFIAFNSDIKRNERLPATLTLGSPRTTTDIPRPGPSRGVPQAAALPSDAGYLVATNLVGPTVTAAQSKAARGPYAAYDSLFANWADYHWKREGPGWGDEYYDRAAIYYAMWVRTANPEYWRRAALQAMDYRTNYLEHNKFQSSPYWLMIDGVRLHYQATGDSVSWAAMGRAAQAFSMCFKTSAENPNCYISPLSYNQDVRNPARMLQSVLYAWEFESPSDPTTSPWKKLGSPEWAALLKRGTDLMLSNQQPDGSYKSEEFCNGVAPYQIGILNDQWIRQYRDFSADPRLVASVTKAVDWLWSTQWTGTAFHYTSVNCPKNSTGTNVGGTEAAPDLTPMLAQSFAFVATHRKTAADTANARTVFSAGVAGAYYTGSKQFNQAYAGSWLALPLFVKSRD